MQCDADDDELEEVLIECINEHNRVAQGDDMNQLSDDTLIYDVKYVEIEKKERG